jgi:hypothetical protein
VVRKKRLGEILVEAGELTQDQLEFALTEQKKGRQQQKTSGRAPGGFKVHDRAPDP